MLLHKKKVLITGASQGLGKEIAKGFILEGADIFICSRSIDNLKNTFLELKKLASQGQQIYYKSIDVSNPDEVNDLLNEFFNKFNRIDVLVNNAGILGPKGPFENVNWEEWLYAFNINFAGSAYLIFKLIKKFKQQNNGCIIQISGGGATSPFPYMTAYASSKAAIVRFIESVSIELSSYNVTANCISPGALDTRMQKEVLEAGPDAVGKEYYDKIFEFKKKGFSPFHKAVSLVINLACGTKLQKLSGKLISAIWDDWRDFENNQDDLNNSEIYTLRRVTEKKKQ